MPCHVSFPRPVCLQYDNEEIVFSHGIRDIAFHRVTIRQNQTKKKKREPKSYPPEIYRFHASEDTAEVFFLIQAGAELLLTWEDKHHRLTAAQMNTR